MKQRLNVGVVGAVEAVGLLALMLMLALMPAAPGFSSAMAADFPSAAITVTRDVIPGGAFAISASSWGGPASAALSLSVNIGGEWYHWPYWTDQEYSTPTGGKLFMLPLVVGVLPEGVEPVHLIWQATLWDYRGAGAEILAVDSAYMEIL